MDDRLTTPCMDNNRLVVVSETKVDLELALKLAFRHAREAWSWWEWTPKEPTYEYDKRDYPDFLGVPDKAKFLVLSTDGNPKYATGSIGGVLTDLRPGQNRFPMGIGVELAIDFAENWLKQQNYGEEPDHDGSNGKGFIVFNQTWGHVAGDHGSFVAIGPAWAMRGK